MNNALKYLFKFCVQTGTNVSVFLLNKIIYASYVLHFYFFGFMNFG